MSAAMSLYPVWRDRGSQAEGSIDKERSEQGRFASDTVAQNPSHEPADEHATEHSR